MSERDDGGFMSGGWRDSQVGERDFGGTLGSGLGSPGKRTLTSGLGGPVAPGQVYRRIDHVRALVEIVRADLLPRLRAAIAARTLDGARTAARDLRRDLAEIDRELGEASRLTREPEACGEIDEVARLREALRFEVEPVLAQAPPPAPAMSSSEPVLIAHGLPEPVGHAEQERQNAARWNADLDAAARPREGEVVAVQRLASGYPVDDMELPDIAARGVSGRGSPLPHLGAIQRSFGAHDVTAVEAHVGGDAATAARAIGAEAYATGNRVAFAAEPGLFVAAHEAAHVVQQRAGVQLLGGVGIAGDRYEEHADAVAERVVRGECAEDLLGTVRRDDRGEGVVQRKESAEAGKIEEKEAKLSNKLVLEVHGHVRHVDVALAIEIERHGAAAWNGKRGEAEKSGDIEGTLKALQPSIQTALGSWGMDVGASLLEGGLDVTLFPGVTFGVEVHGLEARAKRGELDIDLVNAVVKLEGHIPNLGVWMSDGAEAWQQIASVVDVKVVGEIELPLAEGMIASVARTNRALDALEKAESGLDQAGTKAAKREAEMAALRAERRKILEKLADTADERERAVLERSYRKTSTALESAQDAAWSEIDDLVENEKAARAARELIEREGKVLAEKSAGSRLWRRVYEAIARATEGRLARYAMKLLHVLSIIGTILDIEEIIETVVKTWGDPLKLGLVVAKDKQHGRHEGLGPQGKDDGDVGGSPDGGDAGSGGGGVGDDARTSAEPDGTSGGKGSGDSPDRAAGDGKSADGEGGASAVKPATQLVLRELGSAARRLDPEQIGVLDRLVPADLSEDEIEHLQEPIELAAKLDDVDLMIGRIVRAIQDLRAGVEGESEITVDVIEAIHPAKKKHGKRHGRRGKKHKDGRYHFDLDEVHDWFAADDRGDLAPNATFEAWKAKHIGSLRETVGGATYVLENAEATAALRGDYWLAGVTLRFKEHGGDRIEEETFGFTVDPKTGKTTGVLDTQPIAPIEKIVMPPKEEGGLPTVRDHARADFGGFELVVVSSSTPVPLDRSEGAFRITFEFQIDHVHRGQRGEVLIDDDLRRVPIANGKHFTKTVDVHPKGHR